VGRGDGVGAGLAPPCEGRQEARKKTSMKRIAGFGFMNFLQGEIPVI
jgi:hypothetical protein